MIIYKVFDEEFEEIMGEQQLSKFAISQVYNCYDEYLEEYIEETFANSAEILKLTKQIIENKLGVLTVEQSKIILNLRGFEVEEIEVEEIEVY